MFDYHWWFFFYAKIPLEIKERSALKLGYNEQLSQSIQTKAELSITDLTKIHCCHKIVISSLIRAWLHLCTTPSFKLKADLTVMHPIAVGFLKRNLLNYFTFATNKRLGSVHSIRNVSQHFFEISFLLPSSDFQKPVENYLC